MRAAAEYLTGLLAGAFLAASVAVLAAVLVPPPAPEPGRPRAAGQPGAPLRIAAPVETAYLTQRMRLPRIPPFDPLAPGTAGIAQPFAVPAGAGLPERRYRLYVPRSGFYVEASPLLLVLGADGAGTAVAGEALRRAGADGATLVALWKPVADLSGLIVLAPEGPLPGGAEGIWTVLGDLAEAHPVDRRRIYLFAHGAAAGEALALAARWPDLWRAVAIHGGGGPVAAPSGAARPPVALFAGLDAAGPLAAARRTAAALAAAGHPVSLLEIEGAGDAPAELGPWLAEQVWAAFRRF